MCSKIFWLHSFLYLLVCWACGIGPSSGRLLSFSAIIHCWLGHLTCKIVSEMTYNLPSGTLNPTIPYHTIAIRVNQKQPSLEVAPTTVATFSSCDRQLLTMILTFELQLPCVERNQRVKHLGQRSCNSVARTHTHTHTWPFALSGSRELRALSGPLFWVSGPVTGMTIIARMTTTLCCYRHACLLSCRVRYLGHTFFDQSARQSLICHTPTVRRH